MRHKLKRIAAVVGALALLLGLSVTPAGAQTQTRHWNGPTSGPMRPWMYGPSASSARPLVDPLASPLTASICANTYGVTGASPTTLARLSIGDSIPTENPHYYVFRAGSTEKPLVGYTFYPADNGGSDAWNSGGFQSYITNTLANEAYLGTNFIRPTDQFDNSDTAWDGTAETNQVWSNMDYLVCKATADGVYVQLDLSFVCKILTGNAVSGTCAGDTSSTQWTASYGWKAAIDKLAAHYAGWNTIAYASFYGEGTATPTDQASTTALVTDYSNAFTEFAANDSATSPHLLAAGGFTSTNNGYQGGGGVAPWWAQVCNLAASAACLVKVYSHNDMNYSSTWLTWMNNSGGKAVVDEEFGLPQCNGDLTFGTDCKFTGITMDRADFFGWNYFRNFAGWVFWNNDCKHSASTDDGVSNLNPGVVAEIRATDGGGTGSNWISGLNGGNCT